MRIDFVLIIVIVALILVGGLVVDEYYVRLDNQQWQEDYRQLALEYQTAKTQLKQYESIIQACQIQEVQFNQEKIVLGEKIEDLTVTNQALRDRISQLEITTSPYSFIIGMMIASLFGGVTTAASIYIAHRFHQHSLSQKIVPQGQNLKSLYVRMTEEETKSLINRRLNKGLPSMPN